MADPSFDVRVDTSRGLIEITLEGQWALATVAEFRGALKAAYARMAADGYPSGSFAVLSNSRTHGIQSKEIMAALEDLARELATVSRKTAVVVSSVLHKMQVQRVSASDKIRTFTDHDEAIAWLDE